MRPLQIQSHRFERHIDRGFLFQPFRHRQASHVMTFDQAFDSYNKMFGGLPIVGDLPAGLVYWAILFSPLIIAYLKGGNNLRFGALPLTLVGSLLQFSGNIKANLICWILAWICVAMSLVKWPQHPKT